MLGVRWSVQSPLPASALADRILAEPRWNGWRDGFANGRYLIAEQYPVEVGPDGFRFVVPSSPNMFVVCRGRFCSVEAGTRVELSATPPPTLAVTWSVMIFPFVAVFVIGLWSVSPWLAIGGALAVVFPVIMIYAVGFWVNARRVRSRITDFFTREDDILRNAEPGDALFGSGRRIADEFPAGSPPVLLISFLMAPIGVLVAVHGWWIMRTGELVGRGGDKMRLAPPWDWIIGGGFAVLGTLILMMPCYYYLRGKR